MRQRLLVIMYAGLCAIPELKTATKIEETQCTFVEPTDVPTDANTTG